MKIKWKIYASPWIERIQRDVTLDRAHPTWRHVGLALSKVRETLLSLGVLINKENLDHNSSENDDFDDGRIWKPKNPVRNLLDNDNSLPQEKKLGRKVENSEIFGCFKKYRKFRP